MKFEGSNTRLVWVGMGLVGGILISQLWPTEPVRAATASASDRFAMVTANTSSVGSPDAIFILDFLTGRLSGAALNQGTGRFTNFYARSIAQDFAVDPAAETKYAMVSGTANLNVTGNFRPATAVLYVAELNSGQVVAYAFPFTVSQTPNNSTLQPVGTFQFRERL
jgi:hypothetical protein